MGTWEVDRSRWPNGLRQSSDWLHAHQARQIAWFEPERAAAGSWLTVNHPEWCFGGAGGGLMRIGDAGYRRWITDRIEDIDGGEPRELSGRELLESGLQVTAADPQTALLLTYRRQP